MTWPRFGPEEIEAVTEVLKSGKVNYWTGDYIQKFEAEFSRFTRAEFSLAVMNGSVALDLAMEVLGVSCGDEVIVPCRTYYASAGCIVRAGATPVFVDVDRETQNLSIESIEEAVTSRTKAIICVHLAGWPCDMVEIVEFARRRGLFVVEDCAQAHGATIGGRSVGTFGDLGCWSFCQDKIISTGGEGGMVTTNSAEYAAKLWCLRDHGKNQLRTLEQRVTLADGRYKYLHDEVGSNFRMSGIQAVIGTIQLKALRQVQMIRYRNARLIWSSLQELDLIRTPSEFSLDRFSESGDLRHAAYKCYFFFEAGQEFRDRMMKLLIERGVPCGQGACPELYRERAFLGRSSANGNFEGARSLSSSAIALLCDNTVTNTLIKTWTEHVSEVHKLLLS